MSTDALTQRVIDIIIDWPAPAVKVTADSRLIDDLGFDEVDIVELVMALEEEFGIEIDDDTIYECDPATPAQVAEMLRVAVRRGGGMSTTPDARLEAGREMDALVAEKVMGCVWERDPADDYAMLRWPGKNWVAKEVNRGEVHYGVLPNYSTDIADAWLVVEKMRERGYGVEVARIALPDEEWYASFGGSEANASTAPLAICRAALVAMEGA